MNVDCIGKRIAELRREKGVKQDELAKYVGVTAQAVSKWENGGVPDTELLPRIADFFSIPTDSLFGREVGEYFTVEDAILRDISSRDPEEQIARVFELCWVMEQSMYGMIFSDPRQVKEEAELHGETDQVYSKMLRDSGYTEMGLFNRMQYFLLVPDSPDKDKALFDGIDYPALFRVLGEKDFFDTLVMLYRRESTNSFTARLLVKELGLSPERAGEIVAKLHEMNLLGKTVAEIDDEQIELYLFRPRPAFISMLIFAREMIDIPNNFYVSHEGRKKPYLK